MDKMPCLPVKITSKVWADNLQETGSVFMNSLYAYGSWSAIERHKKKDAQMKSGIQEDIGEGIVRRVDPSIGDSFFNLLPEDLRSVMKAAYYIDQDRYQFYKVYCMYGLTYLMSERKFMRPDERLREFGDTAVIIYNPNEFLERVLRCLRQNFEDNVNFKLDEVHYYPSDYFGDLDEFCKDEHYAWQNEIRMRVALLDKNTEIVDQNGQVKKRILQDTTPITLEIGSIKDISIQISTEDLINLRLPSIIQPPDYL